jgi:tetratricopeptide (TPR) repeat protein
MSQPLAQGIATIRVLIGQGNVDEAILETEALLAEHPESLRLLMLRARLDEISLDKTAAAKRYLEIIDLFPTECQPVELLCRLLISRQSFDEAEDYLLKLTALNCPLPRIFRLKVLLAQKQRDQEAEMAALSELITVLDKPEEKTFRRLANLYFENGRNDLLQGLLDKSLISFPHSNELLLLRLKLLQIEGDAEAAIAFCQQLIANDPSQVLWIKTLTRLLVDAGERLQAEQVIRNALRDGYACAELCSFACKMILPIDIKQLLWHWANQVGQQSTAEEQITAANIKLGLSGESFCSLQGGDNTDSTILNMQTKFNVPADNELKRPLLQDKMEEITIATAATTDTIVIVFTGLANRTGMPLVILDRFFAKLNVSTVYLRDPTRLLFNNGVSALGNCFDSSVAYLKELIAESGASNVVSFGISAGGFAAIRYGLALKANLIIGFGAAVNLRAEFLKDDGRAKIIVKRLQGLSANILDLKPLIQASAGNIPIHLYYSEHMPQDTLHAKHIEHEPGVVLHELKNEREHNILGLFAEKGELFDILDSHLTF